MFQALDEIACILSHPNLVAIAHELGVFMVFLCSAWLWRNHRKSRPTQKLRRDAWKSAPVSAPQCQARVESGLQSVVCNSKDLVSKGVTVLAQPEHAHNQMMQHLDRREFTLALNMYRVLEREGKDALFTEELYSAFCQSAIKVGKIDVMELMLRAMRRNRLIPSLQFWHTLLKMLSSRKLFEICLCVHTMWGKLVPTDSIIHSCLINAALEVGNGERALAIIHEYDQLELEPNNYILHFRTFAATNELGAAEICFRKLGPKMTPMMLNLLLLTCVKVSEPHRAHDILRQAHNVEVANQVSGIVDVVSYNTVLKGYVQAGLCAPCMGCFKELLEHFIEPDEITIGTLFEISSSGGKLDLASEMVSLIMGGSASVSTMTSTLFIKGFVRASSLPKALEVYEAMRSRAGSQPDTITYSVLMRAMADAHDLRKALELLRHMKAANIQPDDTILTHLLDNCRNNNNIKKGKQLFEEMVKMGVTPSEFTLVALLKLHGRCGCQEEAFVVLSNWEKNFGKAPSVIHFTCIISACIWCKKYDLAWATLELMRERGVEADSVALTTMLQGLVAGAKWQRVVDLAKLTFTTEGSCHLPAGAWNVALTKMSTIGGDSSCAKQLKQLIVHSHLPNTVRDMRQR